MEASLGSAPLATQNVETDWKTLSELIYSAATEILGSSTRKHEDWFDENCGDIKQLLEEKQCLQVNYEKRCIQKYP